MRECDAERLRWDCAVLMMLLENGQIECGLADDPTPLKSPSATPIRFGFGDRERPVTEWLMRSPQLKPDFTNRLAGRPASRRRTGHESRAPPPTPKVFQGLRTPLEIHRLERGRALSEYDAGTRRAVRPDIADHVRAASSTARSWSPPPRVRRFARRSTQRPTRRPALDDRRGDPTADVDRAVRAAR